MICAYAYSMGIPVALGPREVSIKITLAPKQRAYDPDAYRKTVHDGLVAARLLIDDNRQFVREGQVEFDRGYQRGTVITLTDLYESA
jgi:hypothetical protein